LRMAGYRLNCEFALSANGGGSMLRFVLAINKSGSSSSRVSLAALAARQGLYFAIDSTTSRAQAGTSSRYRVMSDRRLRK
jgi:hypothetical protein